jgi:Threonyl and Alanyl tRNA synthetase second additional domain
VHDLLVRAQPPKVCTAVCLSGEKGSERHWYDLCAGPHVASTGAINPAAIGLERCLSFLGSSCNIHLPQSTQLS